MFAGVKRCGAAALIVLGTGALGVMLTGTAALAAGDTASGADFLTVTSSPAGGFENVAPGDTAGWLVTARSSASVDASLSLRVVSGSTSALATDAVQGLHMRLTACGTSWTGSEDSIRCPGTETAIATGPLALLLGGYTLPVLPAGSAAHYRAQVALPQDATNDVAGQTADLRFEITAVQDEADAGAASLAQTGVSGPAPYRSLALALLGAGSLVLVLRRMGIE